MQADDKREKKRREKEKERSAFVDRCVCDYGTTRALDGGTTVENATSAVLSVNYCDQRMTRRLAKYIN